MLQITDQAASHLQRIRGKKGHDASSVARLVHSDGRVKLLFADAPERGDEVVGFDGIRVCVAAEVAQAFADATIDARTKDGRTWLVVGRGQRAGAPSAAPVSRAGSTR